MLRELSLTLTLAGSAGSAQKTVTIPADMGMGRLRYVRLERVDSQPGTLNVKLNEAIIGDIFSITNALASPLVISPTTPVHTAAGVVVAGVVDAPYISGNRDLTLTASTGDPGDIKVTLVIAPSQF